MAFSDVLLETLTDGSVVGDSWSVAVFRLRCATDKVDVGAALEDLSARDAGEGWWTFAVRHDGHPDMGFTANVLRRIERGDHRGELVLASVTPAVR